MSDALDDFRCYKDEDIETFLRCNAFTYLERGWCSIYLLLDEDAFDNGKIKVDAYFTLSHKSLIATSASKTRVKSAAEFKDAESIHFVLIGQLGKHMEKVDEEHKQYADISSTEILDYAFEIIRDASSLIPCRCVLVECNEHPKVQKVYTDYEFSFFQYDGEHFSFTSGYESHSFVSTLSFFAPNLI